MKAKIFAIVFFTLAAIVFLAGFVLYDKYVIPIAMYHSVEPCKPDCNPNTVDPATFDAHLSYFARHGFQVLSVDEVYAILKKGRTLPSKSVVITFDDGYDDNYTFAYPLLKKYGFPAMIFIPSLFVDQEGYLTTEQLAEMAESNITAGSHTRDHFYLPVASEEQKIEQIQLSRSELQEKLKQPIEYLAYPSGGFSDEIKSIVQKAGYKAAFATNRGYDRFNTDLYEINRIRFDDDDNALKVWAKLSGFYNLFRSAKHPY